MHLRLCDHAQIAQRRLLEREQESLADDLGEELIFSEEGNADKNVQDLERATVDTQLTDSNVGFRLLQKMGWKGKGLGKDEQGIVEPIRSGARDVKLGLGKQEEDDYYTSEASVHRKKMDAEVLVNREVEAERELKIQSEVKEIRKAFFCELCNKQYKFAVEFEAHLSSYDHNHRKRFKDMRDLHSTRDRDDRQKRDQLRQEREMAKQQAEAQRLQQEQLDAKNVNAIAAASAASASNSTPVSSSSAADKVTVIKFGLTPGGSTKVISSGSTAKKKLKVFASVSSVFGGDSEDEQ